MTPRILTRRGARPAAHGGGHHLRLGMHGEEVAGARGDDRRGRALDRRADVVQLPVEEDVAAGALQVARQRHAVAREELQADLVEDDGVAQPLDHRLRLGARGQVERQDEPRVGGAERVQARAGLGACEILRPAGWRTI